MPGGGSAYEPLRNRTSSYDLCGSQTSDQILQGSASTPLVCAYWVEQPILLLLRQDSPCGEVRCVTLQSEETGLRGEHKHRGGGDGVLQRIKGLLLSCAPQPVLRLPSECVKGAGDFREVPDEPPVEVHEPYEGLDILYFCWLWPVSDPLYLDGVHCYMVFGDDKPEVVHLSTFEFAFLWSEKQLIGAEGLEYLPGDPLMVCEGGGVNEDVIHVADGLIAINEGAEDVIHHCLEGGGRVAQSKEHDKGFKQSTVHGEGCLPLIPFFQSDIVETPAEVQGSEPLRIT